MLWCRCLGVRTEAAVRTKFDWPSCYAAPFYIVYRVPYTICAFGSEVANVAWQDCVENDSTARKRSHCILLTGRDAGQRPYLPTGESETRPRSAPPTSQPLPSTDMLTVVRLGPTYVPDLRLNMPITHSTGVLHKRGSVTSFVRPIVRRRHHKTWARNSQRRLIGRAARPMSTPFTTHDRHLQSPGRKRFLGIIPAAVYKATCVQKLYE